MNLFNKIHNLIHIRTGLWDTNLSKEIENVSDRQAIDFYNFMQDNYTQVADGFVKDLNIDKSKRIIITTEQALNIFKNQK
jgi:hypothetical protein